MDMFKRFLYNVILRSLAQFLCIFVKAVVDLVISAPFPISVRTGTPLSLYQHSD